jgi:hypothetical protein
MVKRYDIINYFTKKFKNCNYLEIGSKDRECFYRIDAKNKYDIEPYPKNCTPTYIMKSDDFFKLKEYEINGTVLKRIIYDVVFIDGLHFAEQVLKDVFNVNKLLSKNGYIILHDCFPEKEEFQRREFNYFSWTGDVWKAQNWLVRNFPKQVLTVDSDWGCGIISGKLDFKFIPQEKEFLELNWNDFSKLSLNSIMWKDFLIK